jgi:hypothetical protein
MPTVGRQYTIKSRSGQSADILEGGGLLGNSRPKGGVMPPFGWPDGRFKCLIVRIQISDGSPRNSAKEKTGPSWQMYWEPMLQRPHLPMPHFMRFSSEV